VRPFLVTDLQAGKLPRWGLLLLCALYAFPGLVGRDPWRVSDAVGFGVALTMARGSTADWLMPNVFGQPMTGDGPLPFWLAGLAVRAVPFVPEHAVVRGVFLLLLAGLFIACWQGAWMLAKRPGIQPVDPFGLSASRTDFGRAIADSALLVLLATLGLVARLHETTALAAQVVWVALFLYGCARALDESRRGAIIAGLAIAATLLTRGWPIALTLLAVAWALPVFTPGWRLLGWRFVAAVTVTASVAGAIWPIALVFNGPDGLHHLMDWTMGHGMAVTGPTFDNLTYLARTIPWYLWPSWPVAAWSAWRWRSRFDEPAVALPGLTCVGLLLLALIGAEPSEAELLPLAPPAALLAAVGLPTLGRGVVSLIDWFSVMTFTLFSLGIWAYWIALISGVPATMALKASALAPDFDPGWIADDLALGAAATAAWLLLVAWRVSRQPPMIWRAMVLACGGLVLTWFLLMTLWLPVFNERNTYRDIALRIGAQVPSDHECVIARTLGLTERAMLVYFGHLRFEAEGADCHWLLIGDRGPIAHLIKPTEDGWIFVWQGSRPPDRDERLRLYRR
jgi:4-amino-4-deoxy-L-arabinose transferase-like glycosyltransferase